MADKRINKEGFTELLCYHCKEWKVLGGDNWAWFPEKEHECRKCYDAVQDELERQDNEREAMLANSPKCEDCGQAIQEGFSLCDVCLTLENAADQDADNMYA
jgi:hypothetical protein